MSYHHVPLSEALNLSKRKCALSCFGEFFLLLRCYLLFCVSLQVKITVANSPVFKQTNLHLTLNSHGMQSSCISASSTKLLSFRFFFTFGLVYDSIHICIQVSVFNYYILEWKTDCMPGQIQTI